MNLLQGTDVAIDFNQIAKMTVHEQRVTYVLKCGHEGSVVYAKASDAAKGYKKFLAQWEKGEPLTSEEYAKAIEGWEKTFEGNVV